jgi:UDP-N-acetylglucosamine diphosphorylase / glucose-1-phosphate thymidylyltransferase / UDP-N-acetylgalactosamine diphosphorylase / glucosamine-1-phosphate N-acetyltransferase / galactosamine-1-phosphate N-acetyltransferase
MKELRPEAFFKLNDCSYGDLFQGVELVWDVLDRIKSYIHDRMKPNVAALRSRGECITRRQVLWNGEWLTDDFELRSGDVTKGAFEVYCRGQLLEGAALVYPGAALMDDAIEILPGAVVEPGALIKGPTIIGPQSEIRQGAYIRGSCLIGRGCVVGHTTEMKNTVMLDGAKAGHFAYLGDSVLGREVNLGAGTKLANLKIMPWPYRVKINDEVLHIERRKFGAVLGDHVETGCNSVTSPGTLLAPSCLVAPNTTTPSGYHPSRTFIRSK